MLGNYSILNIYLVLVKPTTGTGMRKVLFLWENDNELDYMNMCF